MALLPRIAEIAEDADAERSYSLTRSGRWHAGRDDRVKDPLGEAEKSW